MLLYLLTQWSFGESSYAFSSSCVTDRPVFLTYISLHSCMLIHNFPLLSMSSRAAVHITWSCLSSSKVIQLHYRPIILLLSFKNHSVFVFGPSGCCFAHPTTSPSPSRKFISSLGLISLIRSHQTPSPPLSGLQGGILLCCCTRLTALHLKISP